MNQRSRDPGTPTPRLYFLEKKEEEKTSPSVRSLLPPFKHVKGRWSLFWEMAPLNLSLSRLPTSCCISRLEKEKKDNNSNFWGLLLFNPSSLVSCFREKLFVLFSFLELETRDRLNHHLFTRHVMLLLLLLLLSV